MKFDISNWLLVFVSLEPNAFCGSLIPETEAVVFQRGFPSVPDNNDSPLKKKEKNV